MEGTFKNSFFSLPAILKLSFLTLGLIGGIASMSAQAGKGRGDMNTRFQGKSVDDLIINYMERNNIPGLSLSIVQAPYITRIVGYGLGDTEKKTLVASNTVFSIGQITRVFTAVAIMQLKEDNKLGLDDSITKYLTNAPQSWQKVTIRDLLIHSSGLPDFSVGNFDYSQNYTPDQIINLIKDKPLLFEPGSQVNQSGTDSFLLGLIVEKASGMFYQDYVTKNQIERLGLKQTFFLSNLNTIKNEINNQTNPFKHRDFLRNRDLINPTELARGYSVVDGALTPSKENNWSATFSNSGIVSSAQDISLWDISLAGDILIKDPKDRAVIFGTSTLKNGKVVNGSSGWTFPGHKGLMEVKGNIPGYSAFLSRFTDPSESLCVTILVNKSDVPDLDILGRQIAGAFDEKLAAPLGAPYTETIQSPYSVDETLDRAAAVVKGAGGTVFARIDHSGEATKAKQQLPPTQVLIIGNPAKGTSMMQNTPAMAIDLPLRLMATQDSSGQVWLSFTDPLNLAKQYGPNLKDEATLKQIGVAVRKVAEKAVSPDSISTKK